MMEEQPLQFLTALITSLRREREVYESKIQTIKDELSYYESFAIELLQDRSVETKSQSFEFNSDFIQYRSFAMAYCKIEDISQLKDWFTEKNFLTSPFRTTIDQRSLTRTILGWSRENKILAADLPKHLPEFIKFNQVKTLSVHRKGEPNE